jgi:nucleoside-diphosphate-sugar epimerase
MKPISRMPGEPRTSASRAVGRAPVLLLGGTGRTGRRAFVELLGREVPVRAIVRSAARLPAEAREHPLSTVVEADPLSLSIEGWRAQLDDCRAAVSCLGHTIDLRGVFGPPRDLVERAMRRVVEAARAAERTTPLRIVLMSSVSVHAPGERTGATGRAERAVLAAMRALVPPARDNQRAADLLAHEVEAGGQVLWTGVRPDTLKEGEATTYELHDRLITSLFRPRQTRRANVARFMADLATDDETWRRWEGRMPVIVDAELGEERAEAPARENHAVGTVS